MAYANPSAWYVDSGPTIGITDLGTANNSSGATVALSLTCPGGSLVVVCVNEATATSAGSSSLSDGTNTYTAGPSVALGGSQGFAQTFYHYYATAQSGLTLTYTKATSGHTCAMAGLFATGVASSTPLDSAVSATAAGTTTSPTVTSGTPSQSGDLIIGFAAWGGASARTLTLQTAPPAFLAPPTSSTAQAAASVGGGSFQYCGTSAITFDPTLSGSVTGNGLIIFGFKPASAPSEYYGVGTWQASHSYSPGALTRQNLTPTVGSERVFVFAPTATATGSQTSGASEPTWVTTKGGQVVDNTNITWQECTGEPGVNGDTTNCPVWTASSTPALGRIIYDSTSGSLQICSTSGAGGSSKPTFSATAGTVTTDSSAKWTSLGAASNFTKWSAPHARLANAFASNWGAAGNSFFVGDDHAETQNSSITLTSPGTSAAICPVYCVDHTASVPPGGSNLKTSASITNTGPLNTQFTINGIADWNGINFTVGTGATVGPGFLIGNSSATHELNFENGSFTIGGSGGGGQSTILLGYNGASHPCRVVLSNTTVTFSNAANYIQAENTEFIWKNTSSALNGGVVPTTLFGIASGSNAAGRWTCEGVDFSSLGSGHTLVGAATASSPIYFSFINCKLGASVTVSSTPAAPGAANVDLTVSDGSGTTYQQQRYRYEGTLSPSTSIVRTGGASDGVTAIAWNITTTANAQWFDPFEAFPISKWNATTGANYTVTVYGVWNSAALPNNDQIWVDVEYLGSASSPLASLASGTKANGLASGSALTADSTSTWSSAATARANSTSYSVGNVIAVSGMSGGGGIAFCTGAGTSSGSQPGGYATATDGQSVTDGTATFRVATRFAMTVTLSAPQPQLAGYIRATVKAALASSTFYVDPTF